MRTSRRRFLEAGLAAGALGLLPRCLKEPRSQFEVPLPIPPVLKPTRVDATTDYYTITQRFGSEQVLAEGPRTPVSGYEGRWPGPTILARRDRRIVVEQKNELPHRVTVHNHGLHVEAASDGHPVDYIEPGATKVFNYPNDQPATMLWYHDHAMNVTSPNVWNGLAGLYIIQDEEWERAGLPSGEFDIPLLIQDRVFTPDNVIIFDNPPFGDIACVNGVETPHLDVAARRYMFRILNGSNDRAMQFQLRLALPPPPPIDNREPLTVVGCDGGLLEAPAVVEQLLVGPAERFAVVVDFAKYPVGTSLLLVNIDRPELNARLPRITNVMQFNVTRTAVDDSKMPPQLPKIERFRVEDAVVKRTITFNQNFATAIPPKGAAFYINGLPYDPARIEFQSKLGDLELWEIQNLTTNLHSFHVHLVQFQIVDNNGSPPVREQNGWKDTIMLFPFSTARILLRPTTFTGIFPLHCHFLAHEDTHMMAQYEVVA